MLPVKANHRARVITERVIVILHAGVKMVAVATTVGDRNKRTSI
jgi:hypothetical protein